MTIQNLWDAAKSVLRGKFIAIQSYLKKEKKISNKQPNPTPKVTRERATNKHQCQWKEKNHKNQSRNKRNRNKGNNSRDQ